ncbi:chitin binding peritrophin-A domain-containing protein [Streptomyces sanglieri]|uniref:chitin binding peritrophin-A domain-containing protein n=1 Tax=Streptomyces sanglieri TaxID=193460 RepID=UPI003526621C
MTIRKIIGVVALAVGMPFAFTATAHASVVAAASVGQSALAAPAVQPDNGCTEEGYFPHASDFKKFYRCIDQGDGTLARADFDCPPGTVYDTDLPPGHCNYPWAVNPDNPAYEGDAS